MVLKEAAQNPEYAQGYAHDMGNMHSTIVYDISHGDVRKLSSTGQVVDESYVSNFYQEAAKIDAQRKSIYDTETAKGTDPVEILQKMMTFTNSQSQSYLEASGQSQSAWKG